MAKEDSAIPGRGTKRSPCPIACALDLLGDRWSLLIIRDIMFFERRTFGELQLSREGIASNILTDRLHRLVANGILEKHAYQERPPRYAYQLTPKGKALRPVLLTLTRWGTHHAGGVVADMKSS